MISIIITVHEPLLQYLQRCVDSVIWQMNAEDELIVVADGCTPLGRMIFGPGLGRRSMVHAGGLVGVSAARNAGLYASEEDWIKFLDADDLLAPFALNAMRALAGKLDERTAVVAGSQIVVHNGIATQLRDAPDIDNIIEHANPLLVSMAFVRRAAALDEQVRGFNVAMDFEEDWDFWLRLRSAGYRFVLYRRPLCYYWINDHERAEKKRTHRVNGQETRAYLSERWGITPQSN